MSNDLSFQDVLKTLDMAPLEPEGGFFRETYRVPSDNEEERSKNKRPKATAIYYMITGSNCSLWHRVPHDEIFHFYAGSTVEFLMIESAEKVKTLKMGSRIDEGEIPQLIVPAGTWQALRILNPSSDNDWSLLGTTMTPGFDYDDFELGNRAKLTQEFPGHEKLIAELTN